MLSIVDLHQEQELSSSGMRKIAGGNAVEAGRAGYAAGKAVNEASQDKTPEVIGAICGIGATLVVLLATV